MKRNNIIIITTAFIIGIAIFWKSCALGLVPFPGDYLLSWYEPWKSYFSPKGVPTLIHKAVLDDVFRQLYQYKIIAVDAIKSGNLPLWNPYNGSGMPLLAVMHAGFLTPLMILFLLLPGWLAWTLYIAFQPILLSIGMLWYARKLHSSLMASVCMAIVYTTSGFIVVRYLYGEYLYVAACLPFLLGITESYRENNRTRSIWSIPFIILFMIISGQPQMIAYVLFMFFFYSCIRLKGIKSAYITITGLIIIGFLLSAVQLIPTIELYVQANMVSQASSFVTEKFLLPISHIISIIIPNYFGNSATYNYWGVGDYVETAVGIGSIASLLSGFCLLGKKNEIRTFFITVVGFTLILVLRSPFTEWFYRLPIPIISTGVPTRIFFLTTFSICILSGLGLDYYLRNIHLHKERMWMALMFIIITFSTFIGWLFVGVRGQMTAIRNSLFEGIVLAAAICILLTIRNNKRTTNIHYLVILLLVLQFSVGLYNSTKFLPFSSRQTIFPDMKIIARLRAVSSFDRVIGLGSAAIQTNIATALHLYDPNYYDPLYIKRYGELIAYANFGTIPDVLPRSDVVINSDVNPPPDVQKRRDRLFQLLSVRYTLLHNEENNFTIQENTPALPRVYLVKNYESISDNNLLLTRLFDPLFDPNISMLVERDIPFIKTIQSMVNDKAKILSYKSNRVDIQVSASSPAILILTDTYYRGWKAYIDEVETPIYRANYILRSIIVPEGNHVVRFIYKPFSLTLGVYITLVTTVLYLSILIYMFRKKSSHR